MDGFSDLIEIMVGTEPSTTAVYRQMLMAMVCLTYW